MFRDVFTRRNRIILSFALSSTLLIASCGDSPTLSKAELSQQNCVDVQSRILELAPQLWEGQPFTVTSVDDIKAVVDGSGSIIEPIQDIVDGSITHHCSARVNFSDGDQTYIRYYQGLDGLDVYYGAEPKEPPVPASNSSNRDEISDTSGVNLADIVKTAPYVCFNWDQTTGTCEGMSQFELFTVSKALVVNDTVIEIQGSQFNLRIASTETLEGNTNCSAMENAITYVLPADPVDQHDASELQKEVSAMLKGMGTEFCDHYFVEGEQYRVDSFIDGEKIISDEPEYAKFMKSEPNLRLSEF